MGIVHKIYHREWDMGLAVKSPRSEILARAGGSKIIGEDQAIELVAKIIEGAK